MNNQKLLNNQSDFTSLKSNLIQFMQYITQLEKLKKFTIQDLPLNAQENLEFAINMSKELQILFIQGNFQKNENGMVQKLKNDYQKLLDRLEQVQEFLLQIKQEQLTGLVEKKKKSESSELSLEYNIIKRTQSKFMESEIESDEIILQRTTTEVNYLENEIKKTKMLKSSIISQLPVGMKMSDSILQNQAKSFDSEIQTFQADKEKKRFSRLKIIIIALLATAILLIVLFIILMFIIQ